VRVEILLAVGVRRRQHAHEVRRRVVLVGDVHPLQLDVGDDAEVLDRAIAGRQVLRDRQLELGVVLVVVELLDGALAERARADDDARSRFLSAPATISDADAEPPLTSTASERRRVAEAALGAARLAVAARHGRDDGARVDEQVDELHRFLEQAARVVAEVEDPRRRALRRHLAHRVATSP
jgi:hypothetical protein